MADLDGDGLRDLITGCFEGGSYIMRGQRGGGFAAPQPVLAADGSVLRVGQYWDDTARKWARSSADLGIAATPVDWDGDGDQDLLLGSSEGRVYLSRNDGTPEAPAWSPELETLTAGGGELLVPGRHAMPVVADWDGDGRWDILSGTYRGGAVWFRNVGEPGRPRFEAARTLIGPASGAWDEPGSRSQIGVGDIDGDGDLDLLLGDYRSRRVAGEQRRREYRGWVWLYRRRGPATPADAAGSGGGVTPDGDAGGDRRR